MTSPNPIRNPPSRNKRCDPFPQKQPAQERSNHRLSKEGERRQAGIDIRESRIPKDHRQRRGDHAQEQDTAHHAET